MSMLPPLHQLAAARGDGLHPKLLALFEERAAVAALVDIADGRGDRAVQAGPNPARSLPQFLPGNVMRFEPEAREAAGSQTMPSSSAAG